MSGNHLVPLNLPKWQMAAAWSHEAFTHKDEIPSQVTLHLYLAGVATVLVHALCWSWTGLLCLPSFLSPSQLGTGQGLS